MMLTLDEQRLRIQQSERESQAKYCAAEDTSEIHKKHPKDGKTICRSLPTPGPSMKSIVEREKHRQFTMIKQLNGLQCSVRTKECQLLELDQTFKALELDSTPDEDEQHYDQRMRQLENSLEKMTIKITEAERILKTYLGVCDHLHWEVLQMPGSLDQLQNSVVGGQAELGKMAHLSHTADGALDCTKSQLVQMERQLMMERQKMEEVLNETRRIQEKEVERELERERGGGGERQGSKSQKLKEQGQRGNAKEGGADDTAPVKAQQTVPVAITPQSTVTLVKDLDTLREALCCTNMQELETRLVSQKANREQLHERMARCEAQVRQNMNTLAALELQYAQLKFTTGPRSDRFERLKKELQTELEEEKERRLWEAKLGRAQSMLSDVERGVNNLFFRMNCVPVKDSSVDLGRLDPIEKLTEVSVRLPTLLTTVSKKTEEYTAEYEKVWTFLEQSTMMEPRNHKRASTPVHKSTSEDTFQFCSPEEDCSLSHEIKHRSILPIEANQPKNKAQKGTKKS
ncbi:hypothetical protein DPEC_G00122710 [Dallia pectoralis]|uniref:Uncharacterized protein n=1 Tax=Dallia pectoralis TaxID=75939 RepID=A0ACC2GR32_DALPE|nr:hypothetical protein DPEC_G00122710 [Dallia pectoralis]